MGVQTVLSHEGDGYIPIGCFFDPSAQRGLRLVSGTPQQIMEPLKIATALSPWEKVATVQKDFVLILRGATQLHLGGESAFALQQTSLFQSGVLKQIHRTPLLGALVPQTTKFSLGVETMDELMEMKWESVVQQVVHFCLHLVQVTLFPFTHFCGRIRLPRPFLHTFLFAVLQGIIHQLVQGLGWWWGAFSARGSAFRATTIGSSFFLAQTRRRLRPVGTGAGWVA